MSKRRRNPHTNGKFVRLASKIGKTKGFLPGWARLCLSGERVRLRTQLRLIKHALLLMKGGGRKKKIYQVVKI